MIVIPEKKWEPFGPKKYDVEPLWRHREKSDHFYMKRNIGRTHGVIFSQRVMLILIDKGMAREVAYDIVQPKG